MRIGNKEINRSKGNYDVIEDACVMELWNRQQEENEEQVIHTSSFLFTKMEQQVSIPLTLFSSDIDVGMRV